MENKVKSHISGQHLGAFYLKFKLFILCWLGGEGLANYTAACHQEVDHGHSAVYNVKHIWSHLISDAM